MAKKKDDKPQSPALLRWKYKDRLYEARDGDFTAAERRIFRAEFGMSLNQGFHDVDLDVIAGLIWLIDRRSQPGLRLDVLLSKLTTDDIDRPDDDEELDADDPEG